MIEELLQEEGDQPKLLAASLVVTDQRGDVVLEFPFSEAVLVEREAASTKH